MKFSVKKLMTPAMIAGISMICVQGVPAVGATDLHSAHLAPVTNASTLLPSSVTAREQKWLEQELAINHDASSATDDLSALFDEAGDDATVIYDADWFSGVTDVADQFDAIYARQMKLKAPTTRTKRIERQIDRQYREMTLAMDDLRLFVATYDVDYLTSASGHIETATKATERATALTKKLDPNYDPTEDSTL